MGVRSGGFRCAFAPAQCHAGVHTSFALPRVCRAPGPHHFAPGTASAGAPAAQVSAIGPGSRPGASGEMSEKARMMPAESIFGVFRKMVRDVAKDENKKVEFHVAGLEVQADRMVLQALKDPVMHMLRNSISHGLETADERQRSGKSELGSVALEIGSRRQSVDDSSGRRRPRSSWICRGSRKWRRARGC